MKITETNIADLLVIEPRVFEDDRGYFYECFNSKRFNDARLPSGYVQDNMSWSKKGVVRGLHFQKPPNAQTKLVCVLKGEVLDVVVDIRKSSPTYLQHFKQVLSEKNKKQMLIPRGFAHGFVVLSEDALFYYKCDAYYDAQSDAGIRFDDPELNIDWEMPNDLLFTSPKDLLLPTLKEFESPF